jgi:hypothetical protein
MKRFLLSLILFFLIHSAGAQKNGIVGISLSGGVMNYKGDLDHSISLKFIQPGFGFHVYILPFSHFNFSLNFLHGKIKCDDEKSDIRNIHYRNLNFYSDVDEISFHVLYRFQSHKNSFSQRQKFIPYFLTGFAFFHFNPKTTRNGVEYELAKVGTEGQHLGASTNASAGYPDPYKLWQFSLPMGVGLKYKVASALDIGLEICPTKTFTDYLDDVSGRFPDKDQLRKEQGDMAVYLSDPSNDPARPNGYKSFSRRGYSEKKDWYVYSNFNVTYYFVSNVYRARQRYVF